MSQIQKPKTLNLPPIKKNEFLLGRVQDFLTNRNNEKDNAIPPKNVDALLVECTNDDDDDESVDEEHQQQPCVELRFAMGDFDDTAIAAMEEEQEEEKEDDANHIHKDESGVNDYPDILHMCNDKKRGQKGNNVTSTITGSSSATNEKSMKDNRKSKGLIEELS